MRQLLWATLLAGLVLPAGLAAQDAAEGQAIYLDHCATCHGLSGQGDGPMAGVLLIKPVNLTRLAAENDAIFPLVKVVKRIDGRDPLVAHGSPMPVYGDFFDGNETALKTETGQPILTSRAIVDLVAFLQGLQQSD